MIPTVTNTLFLESMFADMLPGAHTVITAFHGDPNTNNRQQSARNWCGQPWRPGERVPVWFDEANCYLTVSSFEPDPQTGELRRRKANFLQMHTVMIDDLGTKVAHAALRLDPSAIIETSPGNYQAFLFLRDEPDARCRATCERLIDQMVAAGLTQDGVDPGMKGVTRYGRLPIGINSKQKYVQQLGRPFVTRCTVFDPTQRYSIAQIAEAWKLDMTPERPRAPVVPISAALVKQATERFDALLQTFQMLGWYHGSNGTWHQVTCPWIADHTDHADTGAAISEPSAENGWACGYVCHHGHCRHKRSMRDIRAWLRSLVIELEKQA